MIMFWESSFIFSGWNLHRTTRFNHYENWICSINLWNSILC